MGDKTWAALVDNAKVKRVAGDFAALRELADVLGNPIAHFKARRQAGVRNRADLDGLMDRIAREQRSLGHPAD